MLPPDERPRRAPFPPPWLAPAALAVVAAAVLIPRLGEPGRLMFDEVYYVEDAIGYLDAGVEPSFAVHPTLGKWLLALPIHLLGDDPIAWRLAPALAGIATVVLTYLLARRLLAGRRGAAWLSLVAPVLLLADGLFLTQSRIAMLDAFLVLFTTAALYVLVVDRDRRHGDDPPRPLRPSLRVLAGVLLGCAVAVKWSGLLAVGAAGLLTIGWELGAARRTELSTLPRRAAAVVGSLVLVPFVVYAVSWVPWLASYDNSYTFEAHPPDRCGEELTDCDPTAGEAVAGLVRHHDQMLGFHLNLEATHSYRSDPIGWVVLQRPVVYYWASCTAEQASQPPQLNEDTGELEPVCQVPADQSAEVLGVGNPALWWGFLALLPLLIAGTVVRDRRSAVPLVWWAATWLPWFAVSRTAFLFYLAPAVPALAIGAVVALQRLDEPMPVRRTYLGALASGGIPLVVLGLLRLFDVVAVPRLAWLAALVGVVVGAAIGTAADRTAGARVVAPEDGVAASGRRALVRVTSGRLGFVLVVLTLSVAAFLAPVWLGVPMESDAVRDRWWFDSWV